MWYLFKYAGDRIVSRAVVETDETYIRLRQAGFVDVTRSQYITRWDEQDQEDLRRIRAEIKDHNERTVNKKK